MQNVMISSTGVALTMAGTGLDSAALIAAGVTLSLAGLFGAWAR